jgi:hypothetical protein
MKMRWMLLMFIGDLRRTMLVALSNKTPRPNSKQCRESV